MEQDVYDRDEKDGTVRYSKSRREENSNIDSNENVGDKEVNGELQLSNEQSDGNEGRNYQRFNDKRDAEHRIT